jgi:hypothetical protein
VTDEAEATASVLHVYAKGCYVSIDENNMAQIEWDNGAAVKATRGAAMDYVPSSMFLHYKRNEYAFGADFESMVNGKVDARLAWIVCMCRKVVFSLNRVEVNQAESVVVNAVGSSVRVTDAVTKMLKDNGNIVNAIVQQAMTIFALNGESLISRGHHYNESDNFWTRFQAATLIDEHFATLRIPNWTSTMYHDMMHPFDYDWMASLVTAKDSVLSQHINGVALKRLGVMPAGTTSLALIPPLLEEIRARSARLSEALSKISPTVEAKMIAIKAKPLDYCAHLQRVGTADKLAEIARFEPVVVFMYAYLRAAGVKKTTVLNAKSLENMAARNSVANTLGVQAFAAFGMDDVSPEELLAKVSRMVASLVPDIE